MANKGKRLELMQYLTFDIETAPLDFEEFSESQQEYWLRGTITQEEIDKKMFEMALTPLTGQVVCIGLLLNELNDGEITTISEGAISVDPSYSDEDSKEETLENGAKWYLKSEKEALVFFWKILHKYDRAKLVSFNGRNFDAPFLMLRSALHKIRPSRNLMAGTKFNYPNHIDLIDELTFFSGSAYGATKRFNFDFYARAFGLTSPKSEGVDGSMVGVFYKEGKHKEIAEYCMRDVRTTWELFRLWNDTLNY